jgi:putative hemin transport protein
MLAGTVQSPIDTVSAPLEVRWSALRDARPLASAREAAALLGVSECEVVALGCGSDVTRLRPIARLLLGHLRALGRVRAVTRNAHATIETRGIYTVPDGAGRVAGEDLALRVAPLHWRHAYVVRDERASRPARTLQVFDANGRPVHEVVVEETEAIDAFDRLVPEIALADQTRGVELELLSPAAPRPDATVGVPALQAAWDASPHDDLATLCRELDVRRAQACRLVGPERARPVALWSLGLVLERAAADGVPLTLVVESRGAVQRHTGPIETARQIGPWVNVLDEAVTLHVRGDRVADAWVASRPTPSGPEPWLELFDRDGDAIVAVGGAGGDPRWHALVGGLLPRL